MTTSAANYFVGVSGRSEAFEVTADVVTVIDAGNMKDYVPGLRQNDTLFGGLGSDLMEGSGGNDTIYGDRFWNDETTNANSDLAASADLIVGDFAVSVDGGIDTIFAGGGNNYVNGEAGDDYIEGGSGNELLMGSMGNDTIVGLAGDDKLWGGTPSDSAMQAFIASTFGSSLTTSFNGINDGASSRTFNYVDFRGLQILTSTGNDWLDAGAGNDQAFGQDGEDYILGGEGNDYLEGNDGNDIVSGQNDNDTIYGNAGNDWLEGNKGNDIIIGGTGNDRIEGGEGTDWVEGGAGYDLLFGGAGNDTFIFHAADIQVGNWATVADLGKVNGDFDGIVLEGFGPNHANVAFYQDGANTLIYSLSTGLGGGIIVQNTTIAELQAHLGYL